MPEVIERFLFDRGQQVPPGEHLGSDTIDVKGAQHLAVNVRFTQVVDNVRCNILFGHGDTFMTAQDDDIRQAQDLTRMVPVHGSTVAVFLVNHGPIPVEIDAAWIYGVREVP